MNRPSARRLRGAFRQSGFTLLEVLIALVVLAFGLLGFAMLQTMTVRFTESANYRTKATNMAYDLIDQMRSNRLLVAQYTAASFPSTATGTSCTQAVGTVSIATSITNWQCRTRAALGEGSSATVTVNDGVATVTLAWDDQRWEKDNARKSGNYESGRLTMRSRL
jgi:type IV pilus assembly protein PilV